MDPSAHDIPSAWNGIPLDEPARVVEKALDLFHPNLGLACSFGLEDVALIHLLAETGRPDIRVFSLDTGRLDEETYVCADRIRKRYGIKIEWQFPDREAVEEMERSKGLYSFQHSVENRKECCGIRKVVPLGRALENLDAWMTGQRREQSVTRTALNVVEQDTAHGDIWKINPLADWTLTDTWKFVHENKIPFNALHNLGYPSIGCAPCTRAVAPDEDQRAGRWWWEHPAHKECGLHMPLERGAGI